MKQLSVGDAAPPFDLPDTDGQRVTFDPAAPDYKLLVFYKNSCPTCQLALPYVNRLATMPAVATQQMYAISQDTPDEARAFASEFAITMTHLVDDRPHRVSREYQLYNVPTLLLINGDGQLELISPAFVKDHIEQIAQRLATARDVPVPLVFEPDDPAPQLKPG